MNVLFWLSFVINLVLVLFSLWGMSFRSSFGASTTFNLVFTFLMIIAMIGAVLLKWFGKSKWLPLVVSFLPLLILAVLIYIEHGGK